MGLQDLQTGNVLLTGDRPMAKYLRGGGLYGHAAITVDVGPGWVEVLSSDRRGRYIDTNVYSGVGGRTWDVFDVPPGLNVRTLQSYAENLYVGGGLGQYATNTCAEVVADAIWVAGGPDIGGGLILTPNELASALGPPIGRVYVPPLGD
jgi:hypothetical protein